MAAKIEYIWNMGPYQHVLWSGTHEEWEQETEESLVALGRQWYAALGCVLHGRDNPTPLTEDQVEELIQTELAAKVVEVTEHKPEKEEKAWTVKVETPEQVWEKPKPAAIAKPATSGFEDF